ncbi:class IV adenylate cyclase [Labilibaculum sp. K2S]|uniref:class IV adenylate cyclase n=1 Tax=Labilibaculum sp. K2S TaxID=3056386 RepID=UPI0025A46E16|nr:class IV adenylate cyclase [Labilibaculum sp. K2S]MDM8160521.1 class IV adenylate cyclase [Labilibaculum sp. K2S]
MPTNIEFKAYCKNKEKIRKILLSIGAECCGIDHQTDTYFHSKSGTLKLKEGSIENKLIHYIRENKKGSNESRVHLYLTSPDSTLKEILEKTVGTRSIVEKTREIYIINNVTFHIDTVIGLGDFVEIKAKEGDGNISNEKLQEQCNQYIKTLEINAKDLISESYSDLLQQNNLFSQILVDE